MFKRGVLISTFLVLVAPPAWALGDPRCEPAIVWQGRPCHMVEVEVAPDREWMCLHHISLKPGKEFLVQNERDGTFNVLGPNEKVIEHNGDQVTEYGPAGASPAVRAKQ